MEREIYKLEKNNLYMKQDYDKMMDKLIQGHNRSTNKLKEETHRLDQERKRAVQMQKELEK